MPTTDYSGQVLDSKYRLMRLVGEGGMGVVYLGQHTLIGRKVAVKFLHSELMGSEQIVKRFFREAQAAARIRHKNVIDVLDVGVAPAGEPYMVMEYLEGEAVSDLVDRDAPLDLATACAIMEPALQALAAAHKEGIVHRDLKPENIFLSHLPDAQPEIKLIDFGISKVTQVSGQTKLTVDGSLLGTPSYMSPEQARGSADIDHRTDLYSMGVVLYEMLTGGLPFVGENYNELLVKILTLEPRPPEELNASFPVQAGPIIEQAMAKEAADRYQSTEEMLQELVSLTSSQERQERLTVLGAGLTHAACAVGDLGAEVTPFSETSVAADLMARAVLEPEPQFGSRSWLREKLTGTRGKLFRVLLAAAVLVVLGALLATLCAVVGGDPDNVQITLQGVTKNARIYYDDSMVTSNPFRVERKETLVPLRVEAPGRRPIKLSITPSHDQVVNLRQGKVTIDSDPEEKLLKKPVSKAKAKPKGKKQTSSPPKKKSSAKKTTTTTQKTSSTKSTTSTTTTKKSSKKSRKRRLKIKWPWK